MDGSQRRAHGPHKVYGPEKNDLMLQPRKRGINKVILTGVSATVAAPLSGT